MRRTVFGVSVGWIGISMVTDGVPAVLLPHQLIVAGRGDATTVGLTSLVAIGVAALVQPLAGAGSDRWGRFPVIAAGTGVALSGLVLMLQPAGVLAGCVLALAGAGIAQAGHQALLPDRVAPVWRGRAGGAKGAFDVGGALLGFLVLGSLLGSGNSGLAVVLLGVVLTAGFVAGLLLLPKARDHAGPGGDPIGSRSHGSSDRRALTTLIAARFFFLLGIFAVGRFLLLFVADRFSLPADQAAEEAGLILAILALITVLASLPSGWLADRVGRRAVVLAGGALGALGIGLMPIAGSIGMVVAFGLPLALGSAAFGSASWGWLGDLTASPHAGRLLGFAHFGTAGAAALAGSFGLLIDAGNTLAEGVGYPLAFGTAAGSAFVADLLVLRIADSKGAEATVPARSEAAV